MAADTSHFTTPITLDRDTFMRQLISSLGHLNEGILGSDVAGAYIMNVGLSMSAAIEAEYKQFWGIDRPFTLDEYAHVIVDLKQKIHGNFSLVSKDPAKVVVQTTSCPFDDFVRQSPSLCFMTSSVFGGIAARNFGYGKVAMHKRIALGDPGCYVSIHLKQTPEAEASIGKEYFPETERASPDIAEQLRLMENVRQLRQQLGEINARWEEVVYNAGEAISIAGINSKIIYANARWRDLLGIEGGELIGADYKQIVHLDDQALARQIYDRAFLGQRTVGQELRLQHRDGTWRQALISASPLREEDGCIIGVLNLAHDVTAERENQRLKDDFLTTASHELRTPVTTIKAMTSLLLRVLSKEGALDPAQLIRRLETIQREADRLALLSNDLLNVSRIQAGKMTITPEPHDLNELVESCVQSQRERLSNTSAHSILLRRAPDPLPVAIEYLRIEQVVTNLLDNAIKYSPEGGEITVTTALDGAWAQITISDQGIGIPAADISNLFTPFYRASNASSGHFSGLGFGLYLSRTLLEAHGGSLVVQSIEGQGSLFTLLLPTNA